MLFEAGRELMFGGHVSPSGAFVRHSTDDRDTVEVTPPIDEGTDAMLGRKTFSREEVDHARASIDLQVAAYQKLVEAMSAATSDTSVDTARRAFEARFFNSLVLSLDRYFVHRIRPVTGKDGNPLNELEMLCDSLMNREGVLQPSKVIKLVPEKSVTKVGFGEQIQLTEDQFERLVAAFFVDLEAKFVE